MNEPTSAPPYEPAPYPQPFEEKRRGGGVFIVLAVATAIVVGFAMVKSKREEESDVKRLGELEAAEAADLEARQRAARFAELRLRFPHARADELAAMAAAPAPGFAGGWT